MQNGKTQFIAGALIGATVNVTIQIAQIAMDYDRPFDWNEFFLCTGAGAFITGKDAFHRVPNPLQSAASLPLPAGEGWGEGEGSIRKPIEQDPGIVDLPAIQSFRRLLSAALVAWALSGKHTLKFSRATRLALWTFGISHLSRIALDSATPKPINLI
jgi:hypothetical protein